MANEKILNWVDYNQALIDRGNLNLWLNNEDLNNWYDKGSNLLGAPRIYSDQAIECALLIRFFLT